MNKSRILICSSFKAIHLSLQKIWTKHIYSFGFVLRSLDYIFEVSKLVAVWTLNRGTEISQILLKIYIFNHQPCL